MAPALPRPPSGCGAPALRIAVLLGLVVMYGYASFAHASACKTDYEVCVVGAGGAGTFAAVQLKKKGHSVLLLEKEDRVGGHCKTWIDPVMNFPIETGVVLFPNNTFITQVFKDFNVTLKPFDTATFTGATPLRFSPTGAYLGPDTATVNATAYEQAFATFKNLMATRFAYIETDNGALPDFSKLPPATVAMLLAPFGTFMDSLEAELGHGFFAPLQSLLRTLFYAVGPIREINTLTALRNLRPSILDLFFGRSYQVAGGCSTIYNSFKDYLGPNSVKLKVAPFSIKRSKRSVSVTYTQGNASVNATCRRLIVAAAQSRGNLVSFIKDLDNKEKGVFSQVTFSSYSNAVIRTLRSSVRPFTFSRYLVDNYTFADMPLTIAAQDYNFLGSGLALTLDRTPKSTVDSVSDLMFTSLTAWSLSSGGVINIPQNKTQLFQDGPNVWAYMPRPKNVTTLPALYRQLYALQGYRNTYYTGALLSFNAQYDVWRYSNWLVDNQKWTC